MLIIDALGYLLDSTHLQGRLRGIYLSAGDEMVNNHFTNDFVLSVIVERESCSSIRDCLTVFYETSGAIVSDRNTEF